MREEFYIYSKLIKFFFAFMTLPLIFIYVPGLTTDMMTELEEGLDSSVEATAPEDPKQQTSPEEAVNEDAAKDDILGIDDMFNAGEEEPQSEPADLTWLWVTLAGVGSVAVLGGVGVGVHRYGGIVRRRRAETRKENTALQKRWNTAVTIHKKVAAEYANYLFSLENIFRRPALSDPTVPLTAAFLEVYTQLGPPSEEMPLPADLERYEKLVATAAAAWHAAATNASRLGIGIFSAEEQKKVKRAMNLLKLALDPAASEWERMSSYQQVRKLLDGLISVPQEVYLAIEEKSRLLLTSSASQGPQQLSA